MVSDDERLSGSEARRMLETGDVGPGGAPYCFVGHNISVATLE